jgi:hypothetical protein
MPSPGSARIAGIRMGSATNDPISDFGFWIADCQTDDRGRITEVRGRRSEVGGQRSEVGGLRSEIRGRRLEDRGRRSEVRGGNMDPSSSDRAGLCRG